MMIRKHLGKLLVMATVVMAVAMASTAAFAAKGVIKIHEGDWTGNLVFGKLAQIILSEEMDYKVALVPNTIETIEIFGKVLEELDR